MPGAKRLDWLDFGFLFLQPLPMFQNFLLIRHTFMNEPILDPIVPRMIDSPIPLKWQSAAKRFQRRLIRRR